MQLQMYGIAYMRVLYRGYVIEPQLRCSKHAGCINTAAFALAEKRWVNDRKMVQRIYDTYEHSAY